MLELQRLHLRIVTYITRHVLGMEDWQQNRVDVPAKSSRANITEYLVSVGRERRHRDAPDDHLQLMAACCPVIDPKMRPLVNTTGEASFFGGKEIY